MRFALVFALLLAIAAIFFASQNGDKPDVTMDVGSYVLSASFPIFVIGTLLAGVVIGVLASIPARVASSLRARRAEKKLAEFEDARVASAATRVEAAGERAASRADEVAYARTDAARTDAAEARADARIDAAEAHHDAAETQRLADEVAARTAASRTDAPPPIDPIR